MRGKIIKGIAGFYYVYGEDGELYECKAKGIFRKDNQKPLVGDNVEITILDQVEKEGNLVGFETMENNFMNTTGKAVQYVNMVDSAYLKIYPDAGNITNAAVENRHDVCEDLSLGKGKLIALHLKETKPGKFREVPFLTGHVQFEKIIGTAWKLGVRRYVTELWDIGKDTWKEDILFANQSMRAILDQEA